ncbi:polyunsaturated fatty acid lipoxygenase ALOX15B-like [Genypterus blacodes]|uniref:polyunsaturated fatty acid lipoxygenase ALOX15B-like n=1 Tax=Genypterus blacodes TaxID=154954 RepID=UPI003F75FD4D
MMEYKVIVTTGDLYDATTFNKTFVKLFGEDGESDRTHLSCHTMTAAFDNGPTSSFIVTCPASLGKLVLIELDKQPHLLLPEDHWFPAKVQVESPVGETYNFPIYHWFIDNKSHMFREGKALRVFEDKLGVGMYCREKELKQRGNDYQWDVYEQGIPHCIKKGTTVNLPCDDLFSLTKIAEFDFTAAEGITELELEVLRNCKDNWTSFDDIRKVFTCKSTKISDYVQEHWRDDALFSSQFLNGLNPSMIQRCSVLPKNFPVTDDMVFLHGQHILAEEVKKGNIYLCDYKCLDGVETNVIHGKKQYLMAPLVLLHKTADDKLLPIAIQLKQEPAEDNPIFFPTDSEYDWLMAKIFVRSADFNEHQLTVHLLRTHLLAEVFAVSLKRNVPMVHPLYKLLIPHTRYTFQINTKARCQLISKEGAFTLYAASGGKGMIKILRRATSSLTYSSLCIKDDIAERGLESVPNFYYRDDGLKLWDIIHRFVERMLDYYYKNDTQVKEDKELQAWIQDIYEHGFLSQASTGVPQAFSAVADLVKFVTMVIFTCSGQHSAVNTGQFDYGGWMPNTPTSLQGPPPTTKGKASEATLLQTLPDVQTTVHGMAVMWLLSKQSSDFIALGNYPEEHFNEEFPLQLIHDFQGELEDLSAVITARNIGLEVPYTCLDPAKMENSVAL